MKNKNTKQSEKPDKSNEKLLLSDVSVSLLRNKAKEYAKSIYTEGYNDPIYHLKVMQTMNDFEAGFKAGMCFCNEC